MTVLDDGRRPHVNFKRRVHGLVNTELVAGYLERAAVTVFDVETAGYILCDQRASLEVVHVQGVEVTDDDFALCQILQQVVSSFVRHFDRFPGESVCQSFIILIFALIHASRVGGCFSGQFT